MSCIYYLKFENVIIDSQQKKKKFSADTGIDIGMIMNQLRTILLLEKYMLYTNLIVTSLFVFAD